MKEGKHFVRINNTATAVWRLVKEGWRLEWIGVEEVKGKKRVLHWHKAKEGESIHRWFRNPWLEITAGWFKSLDKMNEAEIKRELRRILPEDVWK